MKWIRQPDEDGHPSYLAERGQYLVWKGSHGWEVYSHIDHVEWGSEDGETCWDTAEEAIAAVEEGNAPEMRVKIGLVFGIPLTEDFIAQGDAMAATLNAVPSDWHFEGTEVIPRSYRELRASPDEEDRARAAHAGCPTGHPWTYHLPQQ